VCRIPQASLERALTGAGLESHPWVAMQVETKFLRLFQLASLGDEIDGWRVCWVGGWDKCHVVFVVMVKRPLRAARPFATIGTTVRHPRPVAGPGS
jgi:hypothetical protein